jgi:outer membrane scaffolding protein for murein synthesis (MipA/OmpV family)
MKHVRSIWWLGLILTGAVSGVQAQEAALVPLPSVLDFTRGAGWGVGLGAGVEYETAYDGSDEYELELDPAGAVQYRWGNNLLFWEGFELGWRGRLDDVWLVQANARYESGREEDDSDVLEGLGDTDDELVGVVEVRRAVGEDWRNWVAGRLMQGGSDFGSLGIFAAGRRFGRAIDGSGAEVFGFATFGSSEFLNRDFGVTTEQAASSGLPATNLSAGYRSVGLTGLYRHYLTRNLHLVAELGAEYYSSDIADSPITQQDYEAEVGVSLLYVF